MRLVLLAFTLAAFGSQAASDPKSTKADNKSGPSFDRSAASSALGNVDVQSCKKAGGPTGSGHVNVTFAPTGEVSSAVVDSGPYPGTAVGGCVAGKFRGAHVPAFSGAPVTVGKSFTID